MSRRRVGAVSTQAVYNVLRVLTGAGLIRRIEPADSPMRFEARVVQQAEFDDGDVGISTLQRAISSAAHSRFATG